MTWFHQFLNFDFFTKKKGVGQLFFKLHSDREVPESELWPVRNHVKLMHVINSRRGFSKATVLCGGY